MKFLPLLLGISLLGALPASAQPAASENPAIIPTPRNPWLEKHEKQKQQVRQEKPAVVFIGDSITEGWMSTTRGLDIWNERYAPLGTVNLGIGGDRTEQVLWRLQDGVLEGVSPRLAVLLIGINNSSRDSAAQIAEGIRKVVAEIRRQAPEARILLLAVFPSAPDSTHPVRVKMQEVNRSIARLADDKTVFFLDIGASFLQPDGSISSGIMPDYLHLNTKGYQIWADAMDETFRKLAPAPAQP